MDKDKKIITSGSVLKRTLLLADHMAKLGMTGKGNLSDDEIKTIVDSFQNDKQLLQYEIYKKAYDRVNTFLYKLATYRLAYAEVIQLLDKILILSASAHDIKSVWEAAKNSIKSTEEATRFEKAIENNPSPISGAFFHAFFNTEIYQESQQELKEQITFLKKNSREGLIEVKTAIQAYKDFVEETKFNIKTFSKFISNVESWAKGSKDNLYFVRNKNNKSILKLSDSQIDTAREYGLIEVDYESLSVDTEQYSELRKGLLYV